jgi:small-conductance mechanosensitive channel
MEDYLKKLIELVNYDFFAYNQVHLNLKIVLWALALLAAKQLALRLIRTQLNKRIDPKDPDERGKYYALGRLLNYLLVLVYVYTVLRLTGANMNLILAGSTALMVGVGLGLQSLILDFFSGIILLFEKTVRVGDVIEIDGLVSRVEKISFRTTNVVTRDGMAVLIPNSRLMTNNVLNWNNGHPKTRFSVQVGVAYGSNVQRVREILMQCAYSHPRIEKTPEPFVHFSDFGNSSLVFSVFFWSFDAFTIEVVRSDLRFTIYEAFRDNGITIPFPQNDVYIKSIPKPLTRLMN